MEVVVTEGESSADLSAAFARLYDQAAHEVYRYLARAVLGNRAAAEDLTQETFAAVLVAAKAGRPEAFTVPWVMGVARHKLVDHYRRAARDERHLAVARAEATEVTDPVEFDQLAAVEPSRVLAMLRTLIPEHRIVLILKYVDELSAQEIASTLNRSVDATNSLLSRARRALASSLTETPT